MPSTEEQVAARTSPSTCWLSFFSLIQTRLRHQRMTYRQLQGKIIGAWEDYSDSKITARQLLQTCSHINGPTRME